MHSSTTRAPIAALVWALLGLWALSGCGSDIPSSDVDGAVLPGGGVEGGDSAGDGDDAEGGTGSAIAEPQRCDVHPVVTCRVDGSNLAPSDELWVQPLDTLLCTASTNLGGTPNASRVDWTVEQRPHGSTSEVRYLRQPQPWFFVDLAGAYTLRARVEGLVEGCDVADAYVRAIPASDVHVQLVWSTPADPNETDTCMHCGSDVDLHLVREGGAWWDPVDDCHYRTPRPSWGRDGPRDDPRLDIDDVDGAGPENINIDEPAPGRYRIGVHYFEDNGFGRSLATVRVYVGGVLAFEALERELHYDEFWYVGDISWPDGEVHLVDAVVDDGVDRTVLTEGPQAEEER